MIQARTLIHICILHMILRSKNVSKKGIKQFVELEVASMSKENQQFNDVPMPGKSVFGLINSKQLSG